MANKKSVKAAYNYSVFRKKKGAKSHAASQGKKSMWWSIMCPRCMTDNNTSLNGSAVCTRDRFFYYGKRN